jgi:Proteasome non-ATPase 26S subunit
MQDESSNDGLQEQVWDSIAVASSSRAVRSAAAMSQQAMPVLAEAALGRASQPSLRIAALHALAGCCGAESMGRDGSAGTALLDAQVRAGRQQRKMTVEMYRAVTLMSSCLVQLGLISALCHLRCSHGGMQVEARLRDLLYTHALPSKDVAKGPAQVVYELLQQPFPDLQVAACRAATALCCRSWFAADVCLHQQMLDMLLDPSQGPADARKWRFGVVLALSAAAQKAVMQHSADEGATLQQSAPRLQMAVQAGPYGSTPIGQHQDAIPDVADATG